MPDTVYCLPLYLVFIAEPSKFVTRCWSFAYSRCSKYYIITMWQAFAASIRLNFLHKFLRVEQVVRNAARQVPWMMMRWMPWMKLCVQTQNDLRHHGSTSIPLALLRVADRFSQECLAFSAKKLSGNTLKKFKWPGIQTVNFEEESISVWNV